jgi:hypothetical protein
MWKAKLRHLFMSFSLLHVYAYAHSCVPMCVGDEILPIKILFKQGLNSTIEMLVNDI